MGSTLDLEVTTLGVLSVPIEGKKFKGHKVPGRKSRENRGRQRASVLASAPEVLFEVPAHREIRIVTELQVDFPRCSGCLDEMQIHQKAAGEERFIMCPKSPHRVKCGRGDWMLVPSRLAVDCDGSGSAAQKVVAESI